MSSIHQKFQVPFSYIVHFTEGLFNPTNLLLRDVIAQDGSEGQRKLFFVIDSGVQEAHPNLQTSIKNYFNAHADVLLLNGDLTIVPGGERCKNQPELVQQLLEAVNEYGIDRHSYMLAIGGGALLDMVGYVASIAHRGIRHIRIPTTVLSQNDSGIGVKNSVNAFGKKNFLGNFAPPYAVLNDFDFLTTLNERDWRSGISEAIKVSLIKDETFFRFIQENAEKLAQRDMPAMQYLIYRCAEMHLQHIAGGDPFEQGSSRPLDFGHWSAHKMEALSNYEIRHGEAVSLGIALDSVYSHLTNRISADELEQILTVIHTLGFDLYVPELDEHLEDASHPNSLLHGLQEFREHLGGKLTITLLDRIGKGVEVNRMDNELIIASIQYLKKYYYQLSPVSESK
ncbi:3-dehydroquinate synthase [Adhaeribacter rhizoryzae]|uniref:3-dehydroquinate synthase n=1 Tax=Adhaeribacter rhizoryzae TaxID=2607907 RepID=A0A5M6CWM6_9BACT|nr:3-dehydroquinate synthase [Adhaeribacter rhizoryzae]KAA5538790.1 3-dehydroquinate synthase [Adhaeribacter rhizoryzae]